MHIKRSIKIRPHKRQANPNKLGLFLRLSMGSNRKEFALGITINMEEWDDVACQVIGREDAVNLNMCLRGSLRNMEDIMNRYEFIEKRVPTMEEVSEEFLLAEGRKVKEQIVKKDPPAWLSIDRFIRDGKAKKGWSRSTVKKFLTQQSHLREYSEDLSFDDINDDFLYEFQQWCQEEKGHTNTTLQKQAGFMRWWLGWAKEKGLYKGTSDKTFRPQYKGGNFQFKEIIYLDREELKALEEYDFSGSPHLDHARDLFVFSCYCGLRYSDVAKLTKANIIDGKITILTKKTTDRLTIPLNKHSQAVLEKYHYVLPHMSNHKVNELIKECCHMAGITQMIEVTRFVGNKKITEIYEKCEKITFHAARRTFITLAFDLGIPTEVIMKFSGHKKIEMLKPYMEIMEKRKQTEMSKFDTL